jgi:hypothetical protein
MATLHTCPGVGCTEQVDRERLACRRHWYSLPKPLRDRIWSAYRNRQERTHWHLVQEAIAFLQAREDVPQDVR